MERGQEEWRSRNCTRLSPKFQGRETAAFLLGETVENVHDLIGALIRMTETVETDFHEIFPPEPFCIELERERGDRQKRSSE